ncbi:MAG: serine/threonine protein kinase [Myxococcales bacterium]|nr:serine/threonine protein kinase [Myxococcales bacterium]
MENDQAPPSQDEIPPGTVIAERYKVVKQLGQGGMGVVFQVEHEVTKRRLAIKAMRRTRDDSFRQRFLTEARAACAVQHPAIVPIHDVIESDGRVLMIMDFLEGHDLYDLVQQRPGQRIHIQEAAAHLLPIVSALGALHSANLVHRDIKPENIFISNGKSFLLDLGVAKDLQSSVRLTQTTTGPIGTPLYMSPEQAFGTLGAVDHRADIWALGIVLYECLTGTAPTMAEGHGEMYGKIGAGNFPLANLVEPSVPSEVADLINDMLQVSRHNRPPITRVYDVLSNFVSSHLIASYPRPVGPAAPSLELALSTPSAPSPTPEQIAAVAAAAAAKAPRISDPHRETVGATTTSPGAAPPKKSSALGWFGLMAAAILVSALGVGGYFAWRLMNVKPVESSVAAPPATEAKTAEASPKPTAEIASATAVATAPTAVESTSAEPSSTVATVRTGKLPTAPTSAATTAQTTAAVTTPPVATTQTAATSASPKSTGLTMPFDPNKKN